MARNGKNPTMASYIQAFSEAALALVLPRKKKDWQKRLETLWADEWAVHIDDKKPTTKKLYTSKYRKGLKEALLQQDIPEKRQQDLLRELNRIVNLPEDISDQLREDYMATLSHRHHHLVMISNWQEIYQEFRALLTHENPANKALALMAMTGRRFVEVLKSGQLQPAYGQSGAIQYLDHWQVLFDGQVKTRAQPGTRYGTAYPIPVLAKSNQVLDAWHQLRQSPEGQRWMNTDSATLNSSVNIILNRALRKRLNIMALWPEDTSLTTKTLRALYAEVAYAHFAPPHQSKLAYFAQILGHGEGDLKTAISYMQFALDHTSLKTNMETLSDWESEMLVQDEQARGKP